MNNLTSQYTEVNTKKHLEVEHYATKVYTRLDELRARNKIIDVLDNCRHLLIIGDNGVGKTTLIKNYQRDHQVKSPWDQDEVPVLNLTASPVPLIKPLLDNIIFKLTGSYEKRRTFDECKLKVINLLKLKRTEMVIIDEFEYVIDNINFERTVDELLHLAAEANIILVFVGRINYGKFYSNARFARRFQYIKIPKKYLITQKNNNGWQLKWNPRKVRC